MGVLDRLIRALSPGWAARRELDRLQLEEAERIRFSAYRGAQHRRWDRAPPTHRGTSANWEQEQGYDRREMVDRARQLQRDSVLAASILESSTLSVVGCGFPLQVRSSSKTFNEDVEGLWEEWATHKADSRGMSTLHELVALSHMGRNRDGDAGLVLQPNGTVRAVESDEIASPDGPYRPDKGVDGIDLDRNGKPTRYWVTSDARAGWGDRRETAAVSPVDPKQMIFLPRRQRVGQTRGVSVYHSVSWIFDQVDGQIEATTAAARMAACFGLVIKREARGFGGLATATDSNSVTRKKVGLEPAMVMELDPGETIEQVRPDHPGTNFGDFIRLLARFVGRPLGLPLEVILLDFSEATFSSARGALLEAWKMWRRDQDLIRRVYRKLYAWKLRQWVEDGSLRGKLPPEDKINAIFHAPGWQWVDPIKEIQAAGLAIELGLDTRNNVAAKQGLDYEDIIAIRAREDALAESAGVEILRSTLTRDPMPEQEPDVTKKDMRRELRRFREQLEVRQARQASLERAAVPPVNNVSVHIPEKLEVPQPIFNVPTPQVVNEINVPEGPAPVVNVPKQEPPIVNVHAAAQEPPVINVEAPQVHNEINVPTPEVNVDVHIPEPKKRSIRIKRDKGGNITGGEVK